MTLNDQSKFEMVVKTGDKAYFVHGSPRGLVLGPKSSAGDDHITVGFDEGEFSQVHRKVNGHEEWRVTPELVQAEVDSLVASNVRSVEFGSMSKPGTYIVSFSRIRVLFAIPQALAVVAMPFLWRLVATERLVRTESGARMELSIERRKLRHLAARTSGPLSVLGRFLGHLPPKIPLRMLRLIGRWTCVSPRALNEFGGALHLMVSKDDVGLVWRSRAGTLRYLPMAPLVNLYLRAEGGLPFGKLGELGKDVAGDITFVGRSW
jgi:hypothetical protein